MAVTTGTAVAALTGVTTVTAIMPFRDQDDNPVYGTWNALRHERMGFWSWVPLYMWLHSVAGLMEEAGQLNDRLFGGLELGKKWKKVLLLFYEEVEGGVTQGARSGPPTAAPHHIAAIYAFAPGLPHAPGRPHAM